MRIVFVPLAHSASQGPCAEKEAGLYICLCNAVTDKAIKDCAEEGARSVEDLTAQLGVASGCGRCRECAMDLLREVCKAPCAGAVQA